MRFGVKQQHVVHQETNLITKSTKTSQDIRLLGDGYEKVFVFNYLFICLKNKHDNEIVTIAGDRTRISPVLHRVIHRFRGKVKPCNCGK